MEIASSQHLSSRSGTRWLPNLTIAVPTLAGQSRACTEKGAAQEITRYTQFQVSQCTSKVGRLSSNRVRLQVTQ